MKKSVNEKALDNLLSLSGKTLAKVSDSLKGTKPFAKKPINNDDLIYAYNTLGEQDVQQLISEYGSNPVIKLFFEISQMEEKRKKNGTIEVPESNTETPMEESGQTVRWNPAFQAENQNQY